jgi:transposase
MTGREKYSADFKRRAVAVAQSGEKTQAEIEREMGIGSSCLSRWIREMEERASDAFPGNGKLPASEAEVAELRRRLAAAEEELAILKKALVIVSQSRPSATR